MIKVTVPASTANLGPGFDTIGMAFQLYTVITMNKAEKTKIVLKGDEMKGVPSDKSNLVYRVASMIFERAGLEVPELHIVIESEIPLTRGLGSSASAIVGGMVAANRLAGEPFSPDEIYQMATELEGHPDNVGASLFGGIIVAAMEGEKVPYVKVTPPKDLRALAVIPDFQLPTERAREVLPPFVSRSDTVYSISHSSLLVAALFSGKKELLRYAMKDCFHQPYRASLVPGMDVMLKRAYEFGALGIALSGAGPTLIAFIEDMALELGNFLQNTLAEHGISSRLMTLLPDCDGARVEEVVDISI